MSFIDVEIKDKEFQYTFSITSKFNILVGNSSTGKTTLCRMIDALNSEDHPLFVDGSGYIPPIYCNLHRKLYHLTNYPDYKDIISKTRGNIYVVDEPSRLFNAKPFYDSLTNSDNYFILITRDDVIEYLPLCVYNVFELCDKGKKGGVQVNEFKRWFSVSLNKNGVNSCLLNLDNKTDNPLYSLKSMM